MQKEEDFKDEFCHETIVNILDKYWVILASYCDDHNNNKDFIILMSEKTTNELDTI